MDMMDPNIKKIYTIKKVDMSQAESHIKSKHVQRRIAVYEGIELRRSFKMRHSIEDYAHFGEAFYFYFFFLKFYAVLFILLGLINIPQIYFNYTSEHPQGSFKRGLYQKLELKTTIGNLRQHVVGAHLDASSIRRRLSNRSSKSGPSSKASSRSMSETAAKRRMKSL